MITRSGLQLPGVRAADPRGDVRLGVWSVWFFGFDCKRGLAIASRQASDMSHLSRESVSAQSRGPTPCTITLAVRRTHAQPQPRNRPYQNEFQPCLDRLWPRRPPKSARSDAKLSYSGALPHAASRPFCLCLCFCLCFCCCCAWPWAWACQKSVCLCLSVCLACWYGVGLRGVPRSSRSISYLG